MRTTLLVFVTAVVVSACADNPVYYYDGDPSVVLADGDGSDGDDAHAPCPDGEACPDVPADSDGHDVEPTDAGPDDTDDAVAPDSDADDASDTVDGSCAVDGDCEDGWACVDGRCAVRQACAPGTATCDGDVRLVCSDDGLSVEPTSCAEVECDGEAGCACVSGACVPRVCRPTSTRCVDGAVERCADDGMSYLPAVACDDARVCAHGACVTRTCAPGERTCEGDVLLTCDEDGGGWTSTDCDAADQRCDVGDGGRCVARVCTPGARQCDDPSDAVLRCDDAGAAWNRTPCGDGLFCAGGVCFAEVCDPDGPAVCRGNTVERCNAVGSAWVWAETCGDGTRCEGGACADLACTGGPRCEGDTVVTCIDGGLGEAREDCTAEDEICVDGACASRVCEPNTRWCDGDGVRVCDARGAGSTVTPCELGACVAGACVALGCAAGTPCDDGNACTYDDRCDDEGACSGTAISCADTTCLDRRCNGTDACDEVVTVGASCDDGDPHTDGDRCSAGGVCRGAECEVTEVACRAGTESRDACARARTISRSDAGAEGGWTISDDTCDARDASDHPGACFDAGGDHAYRLFLEAGESVGVSLTTGEACADPTWTATLKLYQEGSCTAPTCDAPTRCSYPHTAAENPLIYGASRPGWVTIVVDGATAFGDEGNYALRVELECATPDCGCWEP